MTGLVFDMAMRPELLGVAVLGLELAMTIAAAIIARPSGARRYMALFVGAAALGCPFLLPLESVGIRGLAGFHASKRPTSGCQKGW